MQTHLRTHTLYPYVQTHICTLLASLYLYMQTHLRTLSVYPYMQRIARLNARLVR
jgi:hypothetical protein